LIAGLPKKDRSRILLQCEPVELIFGTILCEPDEPFQYIYFPLRSFISLMATVKNHQPLEMALIGNEGMLGATLMLGVDTSALRCVVQGTGNALRMTAAQLQRELRDSPALLSTLGRYLYILTSQLSQSAACTHFHAIEPRLARWLLMTHDRTHADHFHLTHDFLADMLGVRRSGITVAAGILQKKNLIHYSRGKIHILDRKGLEAASCECYAAIADDYSHLLR
jgi:CRP-like cAMP-binding protein